MAKRMANAQRVFTLRALAAVLLAAAWPAAQADAPGEPYRRRPAARSTDAAKPATKPRPQRERGAMWTGRDLGYVAADAGYKAFERRQYELAIAHAREATRLSPGHRGYRGLLINSLVAAGKLDEAQQELQRAEQDWPGDRELASQRVALGARRAEAPASAAYAALARGDAPSAVANARLAVASAPGNRAYRIALAYALLRDQRHAEADEAAGAAVALEPADPTPYMLRGYARQRLGRPVDASADVDRALAVPGVGNPTRRNLRLVAFDEALGAGQPQRALEILQPLDVADPQVAARARLAQALLAQTAPGWQPAAAALPTLDCSATDGPQLCALLPGPAADPAFALASAAYRAMEQRQFAQAATAAQQAVQLAPDNREYPRLLVDALLADGRYAEAEKASDAVVSANPQDGAARAQRGTIRQKLGKTAAARDDFEAALQLGNLSAATEVGLLADLGRERDARRRFDQAVIAGELEKLAPADFAYLAARVGDDEKAVEMFAKADGAGQLPNTAYQDAAYASVRTYRDDEAVGYFKRSIDDANALKLKMEPQMLFDTRRAVTDVSREWGVFASLGYRNAVGGGGSSSGVPGSSTLQAGVEAYWRPWGYWNGRYAEVFVRAFETLYSKGGGATGSSTLQGAVGIRKKLLTDHNVVASIARVFGNGSGNDDWLGQLAYSSDAGSDLRVDVPSWWTVRTFAEVGRYFSAKRDYALANIAAGRSFRMGDSDGRVVLFPHVGAAADYDSALSPRSSVGAGPGLNLRYWFREDRYHAPRSYLDATLGYRARLAGSSRAQGVFFTTTLSY